MPQNSSESVRMLGSLFAVFPKARKTALTLGALASLAGIGSFLIDLDGFIGSKSQPNTEASTYDYSRITVVQYRRGNGGFKTLGDIDDKAASLGFKVLRWISAGAIEQMEYGWQAPREMFESNTGGIFYYPKYAQAAAALQRAPTNGDSGLMKTVPLVEVKQLWEGRFIDPKVLAEDAILVYAPK